MLLVSEIPLSEAINFDIAIIFLFLFSSELSHIEASKGTGSQPYFPPFSARPP